MDEPKFLTIDEVILLHEISLDEHGGADEIRDWGAFESAVAQPQNDYWYGHADLFGIAAAYAMIAIATHELDKPGLAALLRELFGK